MSDPIVFISHNTVNKDKIEDLKDYYHKVVQEIEEQKPGTLLHLAFFNDDSSEMTIVHLLADADAMDRHMVGTAESARGAYEFMKSKKLEIYGMPNPGVLEGMRKIVGSGVELVINPSYVDGYYRLTPETSPISGC